MSLRSLLFLWSLSFLKLVVRSAQQDKPNRPDKPDRPAPLVARVSIWFLLSVSSLLFIAPDRRDRPDRPDQPDEPAPRLAPPARRALLALCRTEIHHSSVNIQHFGPPPSEGVVIYQRERERRGMPPASLTDLPEQGQVTEWPRSVTSRGTPSKAVRAETFWNSSSRMLKKSASGVLTSLRGSTYRSVRLASSLAAALLDGLFEHPEVIVALAPSEIVQRCFMINQVFPQPLSHGCANRDSSVSSSVPSQDAGWGPRHYGECRGAHSLT